MYILYGGGYTRAHMTEMVLTEVGAPYEVRAVDTAKHENRSPEFLKINPAGWVPAMVTPEGQVLYETPALNLFVAERHGNGVLAPATNDPQRGAFLSALFYLTDELEPALKRYFYPQRYVVRAEDADEMRKMSLDGVCTCLGVIDNRLASNGPFHLGDRYSLADLTLSFWMCSIMDREVLAEFEANHRCLELVRARPALRELFDALEARVAKYAEIDSRGEWIA
ncbi:MAG: glutathione S-transferase family protein [Hyphomicrobiaceae bacterium]